MDLDLPAEITETLAHLASSAAEVYLDTCPDCNKTLQMELDYRAYDQRDRIERYMGDTLRELQECRELLRQSRDQSHNTWPGVNPEFNMRKSALDQKIDLFFKTY